jgi:hypothetical protein
VSDHLDGRDDAALKHAHHIGEPLFGGRTHQHVKAELGRTMLGDLAAHLFPDLEREIAPVMRQPNATAK